MTDDLVVTRTVRIPRHELHASFSTSGGPGGQHANRSATRVELRFDVEGSSAFGPKQRARVRERLGSEVRVVVDETRSQLRNREIAERRLADRLRQALHVDRPRRATKPSKAATARRLESKKRRSEVKRGRRRPRPDD
jgi:ribosome-associated protein